MRLIKTEEEADEFIKILYGYIPAIEIKIHPYISGLSNFLECQFDEISNTNKEINYLMKDINNRLRHIKHKVTLEDFLSTSTIVIDLRKLILRNYIKELRENKQWLYIGYDYNWYPRPENQPVE